MVRNFIYEKILFDFLIIEKERILLYIYFYNFVVNIIYESYITQIICCIKNKD